MPGVEKVVEEDTLKEEKSAVDFHHVFFLFERD